MKEETIEIGRGPVDSSIGQRAIHETYEPPNPIPQFRPRPKLQQAQPPIKKPGYTSIMKKKLTQDAAPKRSADPQIADSRKK